MDNSCIWRPESLLFEDLERYFSNGGFNASDARDMAACVYNLTLSEEYMRNFPTAEMSGGEYTSSSIISAFNLKDVTPRTQMADAVDNGFLNPDGSPVMFKSVQDAIASAEKFNSSQSNSIGIVKHYDRGFKVDVVKNDTFGRALADKQKSDLLLHDRLMNVLQRLGFDISLIDTSSYRSRFNPIDAQINSNGLLEVISMINSDKGWKDFPEEFSHLIIEGLQNNPLIGRLSAFMNDDRVAEVLGNSYEQYKRDYHNDKNRLRKEAMGKVLQSYLVGNPIVFRETQPTTLLARIKNFIKKMFGSVTRYDVQKEIDAVNSTFKHISDSVFDDSILDKISRDNIIKGDTLFATQQKIERLESVAEDTISQYVDQLRLLRGRGKRDSLTPEDMKKIRTLQEHVKKGHYKSAIIQFMKYVYDDIEDTNSKLSQFSGSSATLNTQAQLLRRISDLNSMYMGDNSILNRFVNIKNENAINDFGLSESDCDEIAEVANELNGELITVHNAEKDIKFSFVKNFLKQYWGSDEFYKKGIPGNVDSLKNITDSNVGNRLSLNYLLNYADRDINIVERMILGMSQSSDIMLALVDHIVRESHNKRDMRLNVYKQRIAMLQKEAEANGVDTSCVYERDNNGKITGNYKIGLDMWRFYNDRRKAKEDIYNNTNLSNKQKWLALCKWDSEHMENVTLYSKDDGYGGFITKNELRPRASIYGNNELDELNDSERKYYDELMAIKQELDDMLPESKTKSYNAVQIRKNMFQSLSSPKRMWSRAKDMFIRREDDTDFGANENETNEFGDKICIIKDANGDALNRLPIHFVHRLDNMDDLSLDASACMMAYATSCVDYDEMSRIVDSLEMTRDILNSRMVKQYGSKDGKTKPIKYIKRKLSGTEYEDWEIPAIGSKRHGDTNIGSMLNTYYEMNVYGHHHKSEQKFLDVIKQYNTLLGMGGNLFANASNILGGFNQALIHAAGGAVVGQNRESYFNLKDMAVARKKFWNLFVTGTLSDGFSANKNSELQILINTFDPLQEFFDKMRRDNYYNSPMQRIMGDSFDNLAFFGQNAGEYFMHVTNMLACLEHEKVVLDGKEVSLMDALNTTDSNGVKTKTIPEGLKKTDGTDFTYKDLIAVKNRIRECNRNLLGGYNQLDKGAINYWFLGRMIMQFRQWMPEHYNRRLGKARYNFQTQEWVEGYYRTAFRYMKDVMKAGFKFSVEWDNLTSRQKHNIGQALIDEAIVLVLGALTGRGIMGLLGDDDDDKKPWEGMDDLEATITKFAAYQLRRMYQEQAQSAPTITIFEESTKMLVSPIPAVSTTKKLFDLFQPDTWTSVVKSGPYKDWNRGAKIMFDLVPMAKQTKRIVDLDEDDSLFQIFNARMI